MRGTPDGHTLQDYWREEEATQVFFGKRKWTRFHLPPHDRLGNKSLKSKEVKWAEEPWRNWREVILGKLLAGTDKQASKPDTRAQLQGICFPNWFILSFHPSKSEALRQKNSQKIYVNANWGRFGDSNKFWNVNFGDLAWFQHAYFGEEADFSSARFGYWADFTHAYFQWCAEFSNVWFGEDTSFGYARFQDWAIFKKSRFGAMARFEHSYFCKMATFDKVFFEGTSSFNDVKFGAGSEFVGVIFEGVAMFGNCQFHPDSHFDDCMFALPSSGNQAANYQSAFRILRQHMETLRNHGQEIKFARLEMQARERRVDTKDVPNTVRWLSKTYGLFSDYGLDPLRPVLWLAGLFGMVGIGYWMLAIWSGFDSRSGFLHGLEAALRFSLPPISNSISSVLGEPEPAFMVALMQHPFLAGLLMWVQGLTSPALLFLFLLALRRRFQLR